MDTTALQSLIVGLLVVAGVAVALAVTAFVLLATEGRRPSRTIGSTSAVHPAVATTRSAA